MQVSAWDLAFKLRVIWNRTGEHVARKLQMLYTGQPDVRQPSTSIA